MKKINLIIIFITLIFLSSCDDIEKVNINPNSPITAPATNVLGSTFNQGSYCTFTWRMNCYYAGSYSGMFRSVDYEYRNTINSSMWNEYYNCMRTAVNAMNLAKGEENDNVYAAALVMKVFYGNKAVNIFGDIPYSEAFQLKEGILYPHYDTQKDIYIQQLAELKEAADLFDVSGKSLGEGDFLFNGDVLKWKKFCNSLRLRIAIRATSGEEAVGTPAISEIVENPTKYPLMLDNDDNAYWWFPGVSPDEELWYESNMGYRDPETNYKTTGWHLRQSFIDALVPNNDPRTPVYFDKNKNGEYKGWISGKNQLSASFNKPDSTSAPGDRFCADPKGFMPLMNCAEVYFDLAEAALKGYIDGGDSQAKEYYEDGIKASCNENGAWVEANKLSMGLDYTIDDNTINTFLEEPEVKWGSGTTSNFDKIALQRWIVLFKQSIEAWTEVRRTDIPLLTDVDQLYMDNHNRPPFRLPYAETEESLNENFPEYTGNEDIFYGEQLWWDKRENVY